MFAKPSNIIEYPWFKRTLQHFLKIPLSYPLPSYPLLVFLLFHRADLNLKLSRQPADQCRQSFPQENRDITKSHSNNGGSTDLLTFQGVCLSQSRQFSFEPISGFGVMILPKDICNHQHTPTKSGWHSLSGTAGNPVQHPGVQFWGRGNQWILGVPHLETDATMVSVHFALGGVYYTYLYVVFTSNWENSPAKLLFGRCQLLEYPQCCCQALLPKKLCTKRDRIYFQARIAP